MYLSTLVSYNIVRLKLVPSILPVCNQVRWKKITKRKPRWMSMGNYKVFRIPKHPEVPMDEKQLLEDMMEEYYRKSDSLRKLFLDEINLKKTEKDDSLIIQKAEEEFKLLLEENKKENERMRVIREETLEREFQEQQLLFLQKAEEKKQEMDQAKLIVEDIIRREKEKWKTYITFENIDQAIEKALDNPVNINFTVSTDGKIKWEGKPPLDYEADIAERVAKGKQL